MDTPPQRVLETTHGTIEYLDVGTGLPVLYFHGTGAGNETALLLDEELVEAGCRLIVPNRPGYAGTTRGPRGSTEYCATLAAALLDHLGIERATVVATSGGGLPAVRFARLHKSRTTALVLQCAQSHRWDAARWLPHGLGLALFLFRHRFFIPFLRWKNARVARASRRNPHTCLKNMSGSRFAELRDNAEALRRITELSVMLLKTAAQPAGVVNDWAIMTGDDGLLPDSVECPTLIIHDRHDPLVPFAHAEWSQECIPQARLFEVYSGGHLIWFGRDAARMHAERMTFLRAAR